jgi:hypothetical protein
METPSSLVAARRGPTGMRARLRIPATRVAVNGKPVAVRRPCLARIMAISASGLCSARRRTSATRFCGVSVRLAGVRLSATWSSVCAPPVPEELDAGLVLVAVDGEYDVVEQAAQQLFAVPLAGGRCAPDSREVGGEALERVPFAVAQRRGALALKLEQRAAAPRVRRVRLRGCVRGCGRRGGVRVRTRRTAGARSASYAARSTARRWSLMRSSCAASSVSSACAVASTPAGVTVSRNAAATARSTRSALMPWHGRRVPCCWKVREHR